MRKIGLFSAAAAACVWAVAAPVSLADGGGGTAPRIAAQRPASSGLVLPIDTASPVRVNAPIAGVVIANPAVAGVSVQNERLLFVTGRSYGVTSLTVVAEDGRTLYHGRVTVVPDETNAVIVTRGAETERLICAPVCRPAPDIGDSDRSFSRTQAQVAARTGAASR